MEYNATDVDATYALDILVCSVMEALQLCKDIPTYTGVNIGSMKPAFKMTVQFITGRAAIQGVINFI